MKITIVGGGNIGTQFAAHFAEKKHEVTIHTSKPEKFSTHISVENKKGEIIHEGDIETVTNNDQIAFSNSDIIFITLPAYCMDEIAGRINEYARNDVIIGIIPGTGGGECAFRNILNKGGTVFGLQRVPSVARLISYGSKVCATGYREMLHVGALPYNKTEKCCKLISELFDIPCKGLPNYLNLTLTPSNPVLHTTRLRNLFEHYSEGVVYNSVPLFYEDWNDDTSELLFKCDDEVQKICSEFKEFDLSYVKSLKIHYESATPQALTNKIRSIEGFKGLKSPIIAVDNGFIPDLNSRYFTADFPYGLSILVEISDMLGIHTPNLKETLNWYYDIVGSIDAFSYKKYGINHIEDFLSFYSR